MHAEQKPGLGQKNIYKGAPPHPGLSPVALTTHSVMGGGKSNTAQEARFTYRAAPASRCDATRCIHHPQSIATKAMC